MTVGVGARELLWAPSERSDRRPGLALPHRRTDAATALRVAQAAAALGYDTIWASELASYDAIAMAAIVAVSCPAVRAGTAIVPVSTRTAATLAMGAALLASLAPGRILLGLGVSTPVVIEGWHGREAERPLTRSRELLQTLDVILAGGTTDQEAGSARSRGFRLEVAPDPPPAIHLAALGPRMSELAASRDGVLLNFVPTSQLAATVKRLRSIGGPGLEISLPIRVAVTRDPDVVARFRKEVASYSRVPVYARALADAGYAETLAPLAELPVTEAAAMLPSDFVKDMAVIGDEDECVERLAQIRAAGVTPMLAPVTDAAAPEQSFVDTLRAVGPHR